jgi:biopolymer transport protein TolR
MAGGGGIPSADSGGKKSVDFQLNLVPFIDLLSVLISFLLMTSVWTEISKIDVKQEALDPEAEPTPPPEEEQLELSVMIRETGYAVTKKGGEIVKEIAKSPGGYDTKGLEEVLKQVTQEYPENKDVIVSSEDSIAYKELIRVMDLCIAHNLKGISVAGFIDS